MNSVDQQTKKNEGENKYFQISPESIEMIAETVGYSNIPSSVSKSLAEDTSYRLRELIQSCVQILRHSKRPKLVNDDVSLALKWSDIPALHGQQPKVPEFQYIQESDIYTIPEKTVDLTQEYSACTEVEVYSTMKLNVQFLSTDSEKPETELYMKYFEKITQCLLSTSNNLVEIALKDLQENSRLQPLLSSFANFLERLVGYSSENEHVIKRIPLIIYALINNPHLSIEPQKEYFLRILQDLLLGYNEFVFDGDTFLLISGISHILVTMLKNTEIQEVVHNLTSIIIDPNRSMIEQCKAISVLRFLSVETLESATRDSWSALFSKFQQDSSREKKTSHQDEENHICFREVLAGAIIDILRHKIHLLETELRVNEIAEIMKETTTAINQLILEGGGQPILQNRVPQILQDGGQLYALVDQLSESSALRIGEFPTTICRKINYCPSQKNVDDCDELYWTMKNVGKPSVQSRWQYNIYGNNTRPQCKRVDLGNIFEYPSPRKSPDICFKVRNWRQRPNATLKKKSTHSEPAIVSQFAAYVHAKLKPISKCVRVSSKLHYYHPVDLIL